MAARRAGLEERLHEIAKLARRDRPPTSFELRPHLADKAGVVVAAAAKLGGEQNLRDLEKDLEDAFARFLVDPVKTDPGCRAKLATAEALRTLEARAYDVFTKGITIRQMEPSYGPPLDTAAPLRVCCAAGLLESRHSLALVLVAPLLADPEPTARSGVSSVLGGVGGDGCEALLRLKAKLGDREPEVVGACLQGLLTASIERHLPFVVEALRDADDDVVRLGLLALGEIRDERATATLIEYAGSVVKDVRTTALLGLAISRLPQALAFLEDLAANGSRARGEEARAALEAVGGRGG